MQKIQSRLAALLLLVLATPAALAFETVDTIPWPSRGRFPLAYPADPARPTDLWVEGGVMRDDNILRLQSQRRGDTVGRVGAGIRHVQRIIGRESLLVDARVHGYGFMNHDDLGHVGYNAAGTWLWEATNELDGTVVAGRERRLVDIGERQSEVAEIITTTRLDATSAWRVGPSFRMRGALDFGNAESSLRPDAHIRNAGYRVGLDYISPLGNTLGVEYRAAQGDAPVPEFVPGAGVFVDNDFREAELAFLGTYFTPDRRLRLDARIGPARREYTQIPGRDFSGTTMRAFADYQVTPKTAFDAFAYREPRSIIDVSAAHVLITGTQFGWRWAYSAKTVFSLRWVRERRVGRGDPAVQTAAAPLRDELVNTLRFGIGWEPERHWQVGFGFDRGTRFANIFGRSYHYTAGMVNVGYHY